MLVDRGSDKRGVWRKRENYIEKHWRPSLEFVAELGRLVFSGHDTQSNKETVSWTCMQTKIVTRLISVSLMIGCVWVWVTGTWGFLSLKTSQVYRVWMKMQCVCHEGTHYLSHLSGKLYKTQKTVRQWYGNNEVYTQAGTGKTCQFSSHRFPHDNMTSTDKITK